MTKLRGTTVLVTGGASGIGRLMGDMCLQEGAKQLIIWDLNKEKLDVTTRELRAFHFIVHPYLIDVTRTDEMLALAERNISEHGPVDVLINNAGIITGNRDFREMTHDEIERTMSVNSAALMHVTCAFLPAMAARGGGHIVNISSAAGMISIPKMSVYCASKWAVAGWSDSLRIELEQSLSGIRVTTVCPSYISTGMFAGVKVPSILPLLKPEKISARVVRAINADRIWVRDPVLVRLLPFVKGILPVRLFDLFVGRWLGIYRSMAGFKGHINK